MRRLDVPAWGALAAGLTLYAAFNAGGYFADTVGVIVAAVLVLFALRVAIVTHPFRGWQGRLALPAVGLGLFSVWSLVSLAWSHAPGRAMLESDRVLAYLVVLLVFAAAPWSRARLRWTAGGVALAAVVVAVAALASRLAPDVFHTAANVQPGRLSFPLTYWNALALLAGIGATLCLHFASDAGEPLPVRAAAAAALPSLAVTLLLTYSRGGVAVVFLMVALYLVLARPPGAAAALAAAGPPALVALLFAYRANLLASDDPTSSAAAAQGHRVAVATAAATVVAGAARVLLARRGDLGDALARLPRPARRTRIAAAVVTAAIVAVPLTVAILHQVRGFSAKPSAAALSDTRNRLTDPSSNGRVQYWRAAIDSFADEPLHGTGAGTYQLEWWRRRTVPQSVSEAHSLYLQTLGELGVVGLVLLLAGLVPLFAALVRRMRERPRSGAAIAVGACAIGWAVHAGLDWEWQMPAVSLWLFALGGTALARPAAAGAPGRDVLAARADPPPRKPLGLLARAALGIAFLCAAGLPALAAVSQSRLDDALTAYDRGDCASAADDARSARAALPARSEPRLVLGWCAARAGRWAQAVSDVNGAVSRDPHDWETHYSRAVVIAASGRGDPRPGAAAALRLDPLEPAAQELAAAFSPPAGPGTWKRRAAAARLFADGLDYPPLGG